MERKIIILTSLALLTLFLLFHIPTLNSVARGETHQSFKVLSICSDMEDVIFSNNLAEVLDRDGYSVKLTILYLNKDYSQASANRELLDKIYYLREFDQIWILDANSRWMYGGGLSVNELENIGKVTGEGRLLLVGMNTYLQNYASVLDEILGIRVLRYYNPADSLFNIKAYNLLVPYNASHLGIAEVGSTTAKSVAVFLPTNTTAVSLNSYRSGVAVFFAFNIVAGAVEDGELGLYNIASKVIGEAVTHLGPRKNPSLLVNLWLILSEELPFILLVLIIIVLAFAILEVLAYYGFLPYSLTLFLSAPGALITGKRVIKNSVYSNLYETICNGEGNTIGELQRIYADLGGKLKYMLSVLENTGHLTSLELSFLGEERIFSCKGLERETIGKKMLQGENRRLGELVRKEPGMSASELAARMGMDIDRCVSLLKYLASYGIVELRKSGMEYYVHPTELLDNILLERSGG